MTYITRLLAISHLQSFYICIIKFELTQSVRVDHNLLLSRNFEQGCYTQAGKSDLGRLVARSCRRPLQEISADVPAPQCSSQSRLPAADPEIVGSQDNPGSAVWKLEEAALLRVAESVRGKPRSHFK